MDKKRAILIVLLSAVLMTALFHRQAPGLNILIFESLFFAWLILNKEFSFRGKLNLTVGLGLLFTGLFTVLTHSVYSIFVNALVLFIFIGVLIYPASRSLLTSVALSFDNLLNAQLRFFRQLSESALNGSRFSRFLWNSRIFLVPIGIIFVFLVMYSMSNPVFDKIIQRIPDFLSRTFGDWLQHIDGPIILTFLFCLVLSNFFLLRAPGQRSIDKDVISVDLLARVKSARTGETRMTGLLSEYKAAVFLLISLNAIILLLNVIDIYWVWFNFHWEGQYLKQFVHEGTWLLILSVLISIALVLYFFRGNLNFFTRNRLLKLLTYAWLVQNALLTLSVGIRNFYYIQHFALAYKRIGVIIFLVLILYGLYTVFLKVRLRKSAFYLFRANAYSILLVLMLSAAINWDVLITRYNFAHSRQAFLHLDFLSGLSDATLPYLDRPLPELEEIDKFQKAAFPFEMKFMTPEQYHAVIKDREKAFMERWEKQGILSWNLPEYRAYWRLRGGAGD